MNNSQFKFTVVIVAAALLLFSTSCSQEKETTLVVKDFPKTEELTATNRFAPELAEYGTTSINFAGDYLVMRMIKNDNLFAVYDKDFNLVDTILSKGQGPNELISPMYYGQWTGAEQNPEIYVFEDDKSSLFSLNINPYSGLTKVVTLPASEYLSPSSIYLLPDSNYIGINLEMTKQAELFRYNPKTKEVKKAPEFVKFKKEDAFYTSQCRLAIFDSGTISAVTYTFLPIICYFDKDFNLVRKVYIGEEYSTETLSSKDRLGGLYNPVFVKDMLVVLNTLDAEDKENRILVFDKDGEPIASFGVGKALCFTISPDRSTIVTMEYNAEDDLVNFCTYPMPEILK